MPSGVPTETAPPLAVRLGSLTLNNPVLAASGTFGSGVEVLGRVDLSRFGGVVTKTVTAEARRGNHPNRIHETAGGMLNSIGLMNPGADAFLAEVLPRMAEMPCARIINVAGRTPEDFAELAARMGAHELVDALELNVSCPNVSGGLDFGSDPAAMEAVVAGCRARTDKPLLVKLTPNVTDITQLAKAAESGGADALSLVNTYVGMAIDWRRRAAELGSPTGFGGLSGPAIKPLALAAVRRTFEAVAIPLVGIGGIMGADDVMEFVVAGATAVQVGTANFTDPGAILGIVDELEAFVADGSIESIRACIGRLGQESR